MKLLEYIKNKEGTIIVPTTRGTIHYREDGGYHIVPALPIEYLTI